MISTGRIGLLLISGFMVIAACKLENEFDATDTTKPLLYSTDFKPEIFSNDQRESIVKELADTIHSLFKTYLAESHIPGVAYGILIDDQLVLDSAVGHLNIADQNPASTSSVFRIASMTKSFTAMAIVKLRDEGRLSLADAAERYVPEMKNLEYLTSDAPRITIENLLTMTAGFPEDNPWGDRQLDESDTMLLQLMSNGAAFSNIPSYNYEYSNTGYALLGQIISAVTERPYQHYITSEILQPLGMNNTYWEYDSVAQSLLVKGYRWEDQEWKDEPMLHDGSFGAMGGLLTSIQDFSKYVSFLLSAWPPRSETEAGPVKRSSLREMQTPQFSRMFSEATDFRGDPCPIMIGYGFGLGVRQDCHGIRLISHGGALPGFGSNYVFFPDYGIGLMAFCNLTYTSPWPFQEIVKLLFRDTTLQPRSLPVSDILSQRKNQVIDLIQSWDQELEQEILAENFYLDKSREHREHEVDSLLTLAGRILDSEALIPSNQLRGRFSITTENGKLNVFFTLSPEANPRVQRLDISFQKSEVKE